MATKKGFFAELQRQAAQAQRRQQQAASAAARAQATMHRQHQAALKQAERAQAQAVRSSAAQQKAAEREAQRLYDEARRAEADAMNSTIAAQFEEIDSLLDATLEVDDYIDLEKLRVVATKPPFPRPDLDTALQSPPPLQAPPEPVYEEPPAPSGLGGLFGRKKHAESVAEAQAMFAQQHAAWEAEVAQLPMKQLSQLQRHEQAEEERVSQLAAAREAFDAECQAREAQVERENAELDAFIQRLATRDEEAVQEYVSMVLGNSVYPDCFPVSYDHRFDSALTELTMTVYVPPPSALPAIKEHKYVKAKDEITATPLPLRDQKNRYASAVNQVALRTLHEVFEADRDRVVQTIALLVTTKTINAATGQPDQVDLLAVAVDRDAFESFDLARIVHAETLKLLKASVSKDAFGLARIDTSKGVRG